MNHIWYRLLDEDKRTYNNLYPQGYDLMLSVLKDTNADQFMNIPRIGYLNINEHWVAFKMEYENNDSEWQTLVISIADSIRESGVSEGENQEIELLEPRSIPAFFHKVAHVCRIVEYCSCPWPSK